MITDSVAKDFLFLNRYGYHEYSNSKISQQKLSRTFPIILLNWSPVAILTSLPVWWAQVGLLPTAELVKESTLDS